MRLTENFTLDEFVVSSTAARLGIPNEPDVDQLDHLRELASFLEIVRDRLAQPIQVLSGFRSPALNLAVHGAPGSAHLEGYAADIVAPRFGSPLTLCRAIATLPGVRFDQVIHEFGSWCHVSIDPRRRQQTLTIDRAGTRSGLLP